MRGPPTATSSATSRIDFRKAEVTSDGQPLELSAREFQLLRYFIEHRGATLTREELLNEVWGYNAMPSTRTVDVHVAWLRQKLEPIRDTRNTSSRSTAWATSSQGSSRSAVRDPEGRVMTRSGR